MKSCTVKNPKARLSMPGRLFSSPDSAYKRPCGCRKKTNPDIVEAYREAAAKVIADPEFLTIVDKSLGGYKQLAGEKARQAFDQVLNVPAQDRKWLINWIETKYDIKVK
jgi:hypothetical protein